jgi:hypothetical protein
MIGLAILTAMLGLSAMDLGSFRAWTPVVEPSAIRIPPGAQVQFLAHRNVAGGRKVAKVSWSASAGQITDQGLFTAPATPEPQSISIQALGGGSTGSANVSVADPNAEHAALSFSYAGSVKPAAEVAAPYTVALVSGRDAANGTCVRHALLATDFLFAVMLTGGTACGFPDEVVLFSGDRAAVVDATPWTGAGRVVRTFTVAAAPIEIPVSVWALVGPRIERDGKNRSIWTVTKEMVATANSLFNANRAGIRFKIVEQHSLWSPGDAAARAAIGAFCPATALTPAYASMGRLNIYFVQSVEESDAVNTERKRTSAGYYCGSHGAPTVIYLSADESALLTLAHEFGHALGLLHVGEGGYGYYWSTDASEALFDDTNLMWDMAAAPRSGLSLGQAYRGNWEALSIVSLLKGSNGSGLACECRQGPGCTFADVVQESSKEGARCPPLPLDIP